MATFNPNRTLNKATARKLPAEAKRLAREYAGQEVGLPGGAKLYFNRDDGLGQRFPGFWVRGYAFDGSDARPFCI